MPVREWSRAEPPDGPGKSGLARDWAAAVCQHSPAARPRAEIELHLRGHLETLHDALLAEPVDRDAAAAIGAALIGVGLVRPEALDATVVVLADRLLVALGLDEVTFGRGVHALLGALAAGYARALAAAVSG